MHAIWTVGYSSSRETRYDGMSLLPHLKSGGKYPVPERSMIFELWGNIGLRKGEALGLQTLRHSQAGMDHH